MLGSAWVLALGQLPEICRYDPFGRGQTQPCPAALAKPLPFPEATPLSLEGVVPLTSDRPQNDHKLDTFRPQTGFRRAVPLDPLDFSPSGLSLPRTSEAPGEGLVLLGFVC